MAGPPRKYDIVVFGASGFTGSYVVGYLRGHAEPQWRIALAGRSRDKLQAVNAKWRSSYELLLADVADEGSLAAVCQAAHLVLNCVG